MSVRTKVLAVLLIVIAALFVLVGAISQRVISDSFLLLENDEANEDLRRVQNLLADEAAQLTASIGDWSSWDDTYQFVQGAYPTYPDDNLQYETLERLGLDFMMFTGRGGVSVFNGVANGETRAIEPMASAMMAGLQALPQLTQHATLESAIGGYVQLGNTMYLVASRPVLQSDGSGPIAGAVLFGRAFDAARMATLRDVLQFDVALYLGDSLTPLPEDVQAAQAAFASRPNDSSTIAPLSESLLGGYVRFESLRNRPLAILRAQLPRDIYAQGERTLETLRAILVALALAAAGVTFVALNTIVVRRITRLSHEVARVQADSTLRTGVTTEAQDEISLLGRNINAMLERLWHTQDMRLAEKNLELTEAFERERETSTRLQQTVHDLELANTRAQEATRLKSEFLATMSHELRTPLNAILGFTGILVQGMRGQIDAEAKRMLERVNANGERLLGLINSVLDLSKIEAGRMEIASRPFQPRTLAEAWEAHMSALIMREKQLKMVVSVDERLPQTLLGDAERLTQIAINLLSNAIKFTERGTIHLQLACEEDGKWQIVVADTGIGIPPHALETIFEEFRQVDGSSKRAYGGTGLGLAITRNLVRMMNGTITVQSDLGKGSTFTVTLPMIVPHDGVSSGEKRASAELAVVRATQQMAKAIAEQPRMGQAGYTPTYTPAAPTASTAVETTTSTMKAVTTKAGQDGN